MKITLILILLFSTVNPSSEVTTQIEEYAKVVNSDNAQPEYLWVTAVLYHSLNNSLKKSLLSQLNDPKLHNIFKSNGLRSSALEQGFELNNEYLLLSYLLNQPDRSLRQAAFEKFYQNSAPNNSLKNLNEVVVQEEIVNFEEHNLVEFPFAAFLLTHYQYTIRVVNEEFYENFLLAIDQFDVRNVLMRDLISSAKFNSYYNLDKFSDIVDSYDEYMNLSIFPISSDLRDLYWSLDFVMYRTGYIDKSLEVQRNFTIPLSEYLDDLSSLNAIYSSHGGYLYMIGKYQEARDVFQTALQWSDQLSDQNLTQLYNNMSLVYFKTGESGKYVETQLKALEHAQSYDDYDHQVSIYRNLHIFYRKNQNVDLAHQYINEAAELAESIQNYEDLVSINISRAVFEKEQFKNTENALQYLNEAEERFSDDTSNRTRVRVLSEKAEIYKETGEHSKSLDTQNQIVEIGKSQSDPSIYLEALVEVADLEYGFQNYDRVESLLRDFRTHDISVVDFSVIILSRMLEARLAYQDGDVRFAGKRFEETTQQVLQRARYSADIETGYWTVEAEYLQLFESYADFLIDQDRLDDAVQLLDRVKTINDASLLQNPLITSNTLTEEELTIDRQITRDMEGLRRKVFNASGDERFELNTKLERLQAEKRELHQQKRSFDVEQETYPVWSVQRLLSGNELLLHLTEISDSYYISRIQNESIEIDKLEINDSGKQVFEDAIESMVTGRTNLDLLYEIGQMIGINKIPDNVTSVTIMADGYLHQLPLDVLPVNKPDASNSYGSATYFVETVDTRHLNHMGEFFNKQEPGRQFQEDFSGFGVADFQNESTGRSLITLPRAPSEIHSITDNLSRFSKKASYTDFSATPAAFRQAAGSSRILHMATHSEISENDPLFSRIHLLPDSLSSDATNQIFAYELFDLNLDSELIMLNSCESGGDRAIQGGGIMGLSRALHYAGARSLILNAWSVNDQFAADFAEKFYDYINDGETKSRALQLTKIDFIKSSNANPHYWGPYILNGNNEPLIQKRGANLSNWLIALVFIAGFILVSRSRQQTSSF